MPKRDPPHSPSPLSLPSRTRNDSASSTKSSSPRLASPSSDSSRILPRGSKARVKSESDANNVKSTPSLSGVQGKLNTEIDVSSGDKLPYINHSHRDKDKCPCGQSLKSKWKIDCSKCKQFWHTDCVGLKGLNDKAINSLDTWLCPFCFVSPVPTVQTTVDVCHVCRNTLSLQQTNNNYEALLVHSKIKNMSSCCNIIQHIDFEKLSAGIEKLHRFEALLAPGKFQNLADCCKIIEQVDFVKLAASFETLNQFDYRLRHLLLKEDSLKGLDEEIRWLSAKLDTYEHPQIEDLMARTVESYGKSVESLNLSISKLQEDLQLLSSASAPSQASTSSDMILQEISNKLNSICHEETGISAGLDNLKLSIASLQSGQPDLPLSPSLPPPSPSQALQPSQPPEPISHQQEPVTGNKLEFIGEDEAEQLASYLESCTFKKENGHSVCSFGAPYKYTGSKSSDNVPPIPDELKPIMEKINSIQAELVPNQPPLINSCLVNKYEGSDSFLPQHSDREATLHPESSIFTLSIGQNCDILFVDRMSGNETSVTCHDRSLYYMSRRSQEVFTHQISKGSVSTGVRYSLTFRSVDWKNKNCTCLLGDSNTGLLRFGSCKRSTFGELMPGQKFWSPRIEDINPVSCMGYANVILLYGINNVRQPDVKSEHDIINCYQMLKSKVKQIQELSPSSNIFVCRLLPTKDLNLNQKVNYFNKLIYTDLVPTCKGVQWVDGFEKFAHNHVLAWELSKPADRKGYPDLLHLNRSGARVLAGLLKHSIFLRLNGGIDRRRHSSRVDGRLYNHVAAAPPVPR